MRNSIDKHLIIEEEDQMNYSEKHYSSNEEKEDDFSNPFIGDS
jgi:hypothetical protein